MSQARSSSRPPWKIFPVAAVTQPFCRKCRGSVTTSGMFNRNQRVLPVMPVCVGRLPVSSDVRDGLHSGYWQ